MARTQGQTFLNFAQSASSVCNQGVCLQRNLTQYILKKKHVVEISIIYSIIQFFNLPSMR